MFTWKSKICGASAALMFVLGCQKGAADPSEGGEPAGSAGQGGEEPEPSFVGGASCAATLCATNTYCDDASGEAKCIPLPSCDTQSCPDGQHCELQQVQCVRAPCPPQPTCMPNAT